MAVLTGTLFLAWGGLRVLQEFFELLHAHVGTTGTWVTVIYRALSTWTPDRLLVFGTWLEAAIGHSPNAVEAATFGALLCAAGAWRRTYAALRTIWRFNVAIAIFASYVVCIVTFGAIYNEMADEFYTPYVEQEPITYKELVGVKTLLHKTVLRHARERGGVATFGAHYAMLKSKTTAGLSNVRVVESDGCWPIAVKVPETLVIRATLRCYLVHALDIGKTWPPADPANDGILEGFEGPPVPYTKLTPMCEPPRPAATRSNPTVKRAARALAAKADEKSTVCEEPSTLTTFSFRRDLALTFRFSQFRGHLMETVEVVADKDPQIVEQAQGRITNQKILDLLFMPRGSITLEAAVGGVTVTSENRHSIAQMFYPPYATENFYSLDLNPDEIRQFDLFLVGEGGSVVGNRSQWARMLYLSIVTITTTGFGDIVPLTTRARLLTGLEAVLGTAIFGLFIAALTSPRPRHKPGP